MGTTIGKNCFVSWGAHLDIRRGKITIGDNVNIAHGTYILSHIGYRPTKEQIETVIEDNVRIFVNAVVLPGVRVGKNSVVGAGSVVMKDVPPNVIVMGNPARVIQQADPSDLKNSSI
jgi:acetyltransferase-like isoleucine patch superfamily enzyme